MRFLFLFFLQTFFFLDFSFKPQIQRLNFIKSLFTHRITPPPPFVFFADNKILKQDPFLATVSVDKDTTELMKGPNVTFDNYVIHAVHAAFIKPSDHILGEKIRILDQNR